MAKPKTTGEDGAVIVAMASILGNIGQALRNRDLSTQADALARHRDQLISVVQEWHQACQNERIRNARLSQRVQELEEQLQRAVTETDRLREKNIRLQAQIADLETMGT